MYLTNCETHQSGMSWNLNASQQRRKSPVKLIFFKPRQVSVIFSNYHHLVVLVTVVVIVFNVGNTNTSIFAKDCNNCSTTTVEIVKR